jgi:hypothetical protein
MAIFGGVGLESFEYRLRILENAGAFTDGNVRIGRERARVPCPGAVVGNVAFSVWT